MSAIDAFGIACILYPFWDIIFALIEGFLILCVYIIRAPFYIILFPFWIICKLFQSMKKDYDDYKKEINGEESKDEIFIQQMEESKKRLKHLEYLSSLNLKDDEYKHFYKIKKGIKEIKEKIEKENLLIQELIR